MALLEGGSFLPSRESAREHFFLTNIGPIRRQDFPALLPLWGNHYQLRTLLPWKTVLPSCPSPLRRRGLTFDSTVFHHWFLDSDVVMLAEDRSPVPTSITDSDDLLFMLLVSWTQQAIESWQTCPTAT